MSRVAECHTKPAAPACSCCCDQLPQAPMLLGVWPRVVDERHRHDGGESEREAMLCLYHRLGFQPMLPRGNCCRLVEVPR